VEESIHMDTRIFQVRAMEIGLLKLRTRRKRQLKKHDKDIARGNKQLKSILKEHSIINIS